MWALLALCQALRIAVTDAIATVPGTDPDRASRKTAVQAAQELVITAEGIIADGSDLAGGIGRAVLAALNPHAACASAHAKSEHPQPLESPPARQTSHQPAHHHHHHRYHPLPARQKTPPPEILGPLDRPARTPNSPALGVAVTMPQGNAGLLLRRANHSEYRNRLVPVSRVRASCL